MPIIINDIEVITPPPTRQDQKQTPPNSLPPPGPTARDIYWTLRKLSARQQRLHAR